MKHPSENIVNKFDIDKFIKLNDYKVIQLGLQDRKLTTIYKLNTSRKKIWLTGSIDKNRIMFLLQQEIKALKLNINMNSVEMPYFTNHMEYDKTLQNNIIIIPLWGASANNSIMEII